MFDIFKNNRNMKIWSRNSVAIVLSACANTLCSDGSAQSNEPKSDVTRLQPACVAPSYFYWSLYFGRIFGMCPRTLVPNVDADVNG